MLRNFGMVRPIFTKIASKVVQDSKGKSCESAVRNKKFPRNYCVKRWGFTRPVLSGLMYWLTLKTSLFLKKRNISFYISEYYFCVFQYFGTFNKSRNLTQLKIANSSLLIQWFRWLFALKAHAIKIAPKFVSKWLVRLWQWHSQLLFLWGEGAKWPD